MLSSNLPPLRLGRIPFLHMLPHNRALGADPALETVEYHDAPPTELNRLLLHEEIDGAPASSIEYALHADRYCLLPGFSVSNRMDSPKVHSVLLFLRRPLKKISELDSDRRIAVTSASATSVALLSLIMKEFYNLTPNMFSFPVDQSPDSVDADALLLIGDRALGANPEFSTHPTLDPANWTPVDLGWLWTEHTGLPFPFAIYMISQRRADLYREQLMQVSRVLSDVAPSMSIAKEVAQQTDWDPQLILSYWKSLDYRLEKPHLEGLERFYWLARKYGMIDEIPEFRFL